MTTHLTARQIEQFREEGYLQLDGLLQMGELNPVVWEFEGMIDRARELKVKGYLTDLHEREPFNRRIAMLAAQVPSIAHYLSPHRVLGSAMFNLMPMQSYWMPSSRCSAPQDPQPSHHVLRPRMRDRPKIRVG